MIGDRLAAQQLVRPAFSDPAALIAWMGAVQAQDFAAARWALGLRLAGRPVREDQIARAVSDGKLLRTHVLRWTWQLVAPADVRWMLSLVATRLIDRAARRHRELGLDAATFRRSTAAFAKALRGRHLTRDELGAVLRGTGVAITGPRLSHLLGHAELEGVLCSGETRGKQATWALLDERVPAHGHGPVDRTAALGELARRYFTSRGPATVADFVWWSGLAPSEARTAVEAAGAALLAVHRAGVTRYRSAAPLPGRKRSAAGPRVWLLPAFDEYLVAYRDRSAVLEPAHARRVNDGGGMLKPCVVRDGQVIGTWRRDLDRRASVSVEVTLFPSATKVDREPIREAAERYAAFLGRTVNVTFAKAPR
jgi:hypothetical protein